MKILFIRFSTSGDILLTSPVIRAVRKAIPTSEIHFLTNELNRGIIEFNPNINKLHVLAFSEELAIEELKVEDYDLVVNLQGDSKSTMIIHALHKKVISISDRGFLEKLLGLGRKRGVEQFFRTVRSLGVENDHGGLDYYLGPNDETKKDDIPAAHYAGYIAMALSASRFTPSWRAEQWKELCMNLNHPIILTGTKEDHSSAQTIALSDEIKIYNACGKFTLNETADLIRKSKMLVSNESDYIQVAAAFKRPVISLLSKNGNSTVPFYGNNFLNGSKVRPYEQLLAEKTSISTLLSAIKTRL